MKYQPKVIVAQMGARRRYAVARILEDAGMLSALYTDSSACSLLGRVSRILSPLSGPRGMNLASRRIHGVPSDKVLSTDRVFWSDVMAKIKQDGREPIYAYHRRHQVLSRAMIRWGLRDADIVYSMYHESLDFLAYAKSKGRAIAVDVFVDPMTDRIRLDESRKFPEFADLAAETAVAFADDLFRRAADFADVLLCPSEWVIHGLQRLGDDIRRKAVLVPYGCTIDYLGEANRPVPGRVLFAGHDVLRKGLPYLAEAANILKPLHPQLAFRVAGCVVTSVRDSFLCRNLVFVGPLSRNAMRAEFLRADIFVLPTLSEGLAAVVVEAMAAGVPVITTRCAGIAIENGDNGLIVPERNAEAIAEAIENMLCNRTRRQAIAEAARESAKYYSLERWKARLSRALHQLHAY